MNLLLQARLVGGAAAMRLLGLPALARRRFGWFPTVLAYHGVHDGSLSAEFYRFNTKHLAVVELERQLVWIKRRFDIVSLAEIEAVIRDGRWRSNLLAITFDDGYENNLTVAAPVLRAAGVPWTLFVTVDVVERQRPYEHDRVELSLRCSGCREVSLTHAGNSRRWPLASGAERGRAVYEIKAWLSGMSDADADAVRRQLFEQCWRDELVAREPIAYRPLTWDQVRRLAGDGVEIGSHTLSHPHLARADDERVRRELVDSRARLEAVLGRPVTRLSYPHGSFDARVARLAAEAGYTSACTMNAWFTGSPQDCLAIPRINVPAGASFGLFQVSASRGLMLLRDAPRANGDSAA